MPKYLNEMEMIRGISLGIGITLGVILTIIIIILVVIGVVALYKYSLRTRFSTELFRTYRKELMQAEKFEELDDVNQIIEQLKKNQKPNKEILQKYKVNIDSYWYFAPTYDGGQRLVFINDKRIMKK